MYKHSPGKMQVIVGQRLGFTDYTRLQLMVAKVGNAGRFISHHFILRPILSVISLAAPFLTDVFTDKPVCKTV